MRFPFVIASLMAAVLPGTSAHGANADPAREQEAASIRALDAAWSRALQAKDLDTVMTNYAEDAAFLAPGQPIVRGKANIRAWFATRIAQPDYSATFEPTVVVVAASRDMAYELGVFHASGRDAHGALVSRVGKHLVTWMKQDGRWKVTAESISTDS